MGLTVVSALGEEIFAVTLRIYPNDSVLRLLQLELKNNCSTLRDFDTGKVRKSN